MGLKDFAEGATPSSGFDKDKSGGFSRPADATQSHKRHAISYEDFIKNKPGALLFFSKHPDTQELFSRQDAEEASNLFQTYNRMILFVYFGSAFATYTADNFLRYKNLIYGMTYRRTIFKLLFKYWLIPTSVAGIANNLFLQDIYIPKIERIANNYSFSEPVFREAFDKGMPKNADKSRRNE